MAQTANIPNKHSDREGLQDLLTDEPALIDGEKVWFEAVKDAQFVNNPGLGRFQSVPFLDQEDFRKERGGWRGPYLYGVHVLGPRGKACFARGL